MELTAHTLRTALFRQAWKGYDTAEVDDFLDEVAAGVDGCEARTRDAIERAERAEDRAVKAETRPAQRSEPDESVRRTLVLAQRAADLVVTEAKSVSERIVADAREHAAKILTAAAGEAEATQQHAEAKAAVLVAEAQATAQRMTATRAAELQQELSGLIEQQAIRRIELAQLTDHVAQARQVLRGQFEEHIRSLDALHVPAASAPHTDTDASVVAAQVLITLDDGPVIGSNPVDPVSDDPLPLHNRDYNMGLRSSAALPGSTSALLRHDEDSARSS